MKKSILTIAIASVLLACNSKPAEVTVSAKQVSTDTVGMSEFQQWKNDQELIGSGEGIAINTTAPVEEEKEVKPTVIYRDAPVKKAVVKSRPAVKPRTSSSRPPVSNPPVYTGNSGGSGNESTAGVGNGSDGVGTGSLPADTPVPAKKEGWSKAAKGTAIGGASGAVLGAIIAKDKKGVGAVIGGVVGAAGGYVLGRAQDKKDGRY